MIARLFILLPFHITVPEGEQFALFEFEDNGYKVHIYPPMRSERAPAIDGEEQMRIDGVQAFQADVLRIDFFRDNFDRSIETPCDPPYDLIERALNSFLLRLRHVAHAAKVRRLNFPSMTWRLQYLNDDETELEPNKKLVRGRGALQYSFSWIALNKEVWGDIHKLPVDFEPLPWEELLLDAEAQLPSIGPSIVLAATALEVFIAKILDQLATTNNISSELWNWINHRGDYLREPTVEEQYDALLKFFTQHSLKEEKLLWEAFKNLKSARNSFVHEGVAKIGGLPVEKVAAVKLIRSASDIVRKIKEWLPEELQWPEFKHMIKVEAVWQLK